MEIIAGGLNPGVDVHQLKRTIEYYSDVPIDSTITVIRVKFFEIHFVIL